MSDDVSEIGRGEAASASATDSPPLAPPKRVRAYDRCPACGGWKTKKSNLCRRCHKLPLDETAFSRVTPESAYWVGFLMADGCVMQPPFGEPEVAVRLAVIDVAHLETLRAFLGSPKKITIQSAPTGAHFIAGKQARSGASALFSVSSRRLADDLTAFGLLPRKSKREHVIGLESNRDFWRGMVDGDGTVRVGATGNNGLVPELRLYGGLSITTQFREWVRTLVPGCETNVKPHNGIWRFQINARQAYRVITELYSGATVALPRKMATAQAIIDRGVPMGGWGRFKGTVRRPPKTVPESTESRTA